MSAFSGINATSETLAIVDELRRNQSRYIFALFRIEGSSVVPAGHWPEDAEQAKQIRGNDENFAKVFKETVWPEFVKAIEASTGPRFSVIDFAFTHADGRVVRVLTSVGWCPDRGVSAKDKMTFASTKTTFESKINIGKKYQANDLSDLEYDGMLAFVSANK